MADTFHLKVVGPERLFVDEAVSEAQIPALDGYIGVLPGHASLMSELQPEAVLSYVAGGKTHSLTVRGGFVEVLPEMTRVLAESVE
jgi:F-type H+-transporting ATPase subunit epsilon